METRDKEQGNERFIITGKREIKSVMKDKELNLEDVKVPSFTHWVEHHTYSFYIHRFRRRSRECLFGVDVRIHPKNVFVAAELKKAKARGNMSRLN